MSVKRERTGGNAKARSLHFSLCSTHHPAAMSTPSQVAVGKRAAKSSEAARRGDALSAKRRDDLADWTAKQGAKQPRLNTFFRPPAPTTAPAEPPLTEREPTAAERRTEAVDVAYQHAQAALRTLGDALAQPDRPVGVPVVEGVASVPVEQAALGEV